MAGLRHNPEAPYCTKNGESRLTDPAARCDYCDSKGLGPDDANVGEELAQELGTIGGVKIDAPAGVSAEQATEAGMRARMLAQPRPTIKDFFDRIGLVKGGAITDIRTVDGEHRSGRFYISDIAGYEDREVVLTIKPDGVAEEEQVRWVHIVSFRARRPGA